MKHEKHAFFGQRLLVVNSLFCVVFEQIEPSVFNTGFDEKEWFCLIFWRKVSPSSLVKVCSFIFERKVVNFWETTTEKRTKWKTLKNEIFEGFLSLVIYEFTMSIWFLIPVKTCDHFCFHVVKINEQLSVKMEEKSVHCKIRVSVHL